jgi:hypothetical protein
MPIEIWVDRARRIRYSAASDVVTDREFIDAYAGMLQDTTNDPTLDHLADFTAVERFDVTAETLQRTAELIGSRLDPALAATAVRPKVAAVAPSHSVFRLLRLYATSRVVQESPIDFRICRTMDEARRWLGLADDARAVRQSESVAGAAAPAGVVPLTFRDSFGVRWVVVPLLFGDGPDTLPRGFEFTSDDGERRVALRNLTEFVSPHELDEGEWRALLRGATVVT